MITVYLVDNKTRLHLPGSAWGYSVRQKLMEMGHSVVATEEDCNLVPRSAAEMAEVNRLLDSTGL